MKSRHVLNAVLSRNVSLALKGLSFICAARTKPDSRTALKSHSLAACGNLAVFEGARLHSSRKTRCLKGLRKDQHRQPSDDQVNPITRSFIPCQPNINAIRPLNHPDVLHSSHFGNGSQLAEKTRGIEGAQLQLCRVTAKCAALATEGRLCTSEQRLRRHRLQQCSRIVLNVANRSIHPPRMHQRRLVRPQQINRLPSLILSA